MADLGHLVDLPVQAGASSSSSYSGLGFIVLQADSKQVAKYWRQNALVNRVEDMESCNPDLIQSPPEAAPEFVPFLRGYWLKPNGEIIVFWMVIPSYRWNASARSCFLNTQHLEFPNPLLKGAWEEIYKVF